MNAKKLIPQKRFKEFKLNSAWEYYELGSVIDDQYNGQTPSRFNSHFWNGDLNWLSSGELNRGIVVKTNEKITRLGRLSANLKVIPKGTFIMAITGLEASGTRGNCAILGVDTTLNQSCMAIFPNKKYLDSKFLFYWYIKVGEGFGLRYTQGTKQQSYNAELIKILSIIIPEVKEQQKIAKFFMVLDERIANQERKIAKVKALKSAYLTEMFPQEGETIPKRRFKGFDEEWDRHIFSNIIKTHSFKSYLSKPKTDGKYEVIQQGDTPVVGYSNKSPFKKYNSVVLFGDHTLSLFKPIRPFLIATDGIKILEIEKVSGEFLFVLLKKYLPKSEGYKRHFTILQNQYCHIPYNIQEQQKIGQFFKNLDDQIRTEEKKLEKLKKMKEAYLEEMFV